MKDDYSIINDKIVNHKKKVVASTKDIKKGYTPVVVHKGERVVTDVKKLKELEKKYKVKLYPRRNI